MSKDMFIIGFMLFALFFGAGNLIYPPVLGAEAGTSFVAAMTGFIITGIGLPIIAVTAISYVKNDARELGNHVHPLFGLLFTCLVYLAIGPFFGIPRAATVGYEMSVKPFLTDTSTQGLWLFTTIFFLATFLVSLNPSKLVDRIGQYLTPILFLAITILVIGGFAFFDQPLANPTGGYQDTPFFTGFIEGYLTMDAIAALAFGIIVVNTFKEKGITSRNAVILSTLKAGLVAGIGLIAVYASIGWLGAKFTEGEAYTNGGEILAQAASTLFGTTGTLLLGVIVTLACFTTSVGLVVATAQFFSKIIPLAYPWIASIITLISYLIANQGLDSIIRFSVPVLIFLYPIAIVLILLTFIHPLFKGRKAVYRGAIIFTSIFSLNDGLNELSVSLPYISNYITLLPLFDHGLGWVLPACVGGCIGYLVSITFSRSYS
ncbi:branched-chain amino acid transport system II carrier protein [Virgibacillus massiliensis]|nr:MULTISPECIES: branched-chain amino acid transport system II carrier protein [Virgibacillus]MYL40971.1 branched-chain amino acid transport system II carrier protein [Virgibacillus massiliensis]